MLKIDIEPTRSYVVDPETGKLLTAREWKEKAGENVTAAQMVAVVPGDGSPAFCFPKCHIGEMPWEEAMQEAAAFKAPHLILWTEGSFQLPTRKQGIDFRDARSAGLDQLMELIGGEKDLDDWYWTREPWIQRGTSEENCEKIMSAWSSSRYYAYYAWFFGGYSGSATVSYLSSSYRALPVLLLDPVCVPDADA